MADLESWIGREETAEDTLTPALLTRFQATLEGHAPLPDPPLCLHWCLAPPALPSTALGPDGHPAKGGFLPPVPLPRRMWAGGEITFHAPLPVATPIQRTSRIARITEKESARGPLVFVDVAHAYEAEGSAALEEVQTIVYRAPGPAKRPRPEPLPKERHTLTPDSTLLFRYSALTFNGHRIHYDHPYATEVEGYAGLVVHGPLVATLLANLAAAQAPAGSLRHFSYRGLSPAIAGQRLHLAAKEGGTTLAAWNDAGVPVMSATATFR